MVNIAADMRATSDGARQQRRQRKAARHDDGAEKPSTPAKKTVHTLAVVAMPATHSSISAPHSTNGQARRSSRRGDREQHEGRRQLAEIERGESAADQVGPAGLGEMARQEGIAAEIDAVDAAEENPDLPDQLVAPVGPPAPARRRRQRDAVLGRRREGDGQDRDQRRAERPRPPGSSARNCRPAEARAGSSA